MKTTFIISSILIFLLGCQPLRENSYRSEEIKGDWVTDYFRDDWEEKILVFSFDDSTCSYIYPFSDYTKYSLSNDTLMITERIRKISNRIIGGKETYRFKIQNLSDKGLMLSAITPETKALFRDFPKINPDSIRLRKIEKKNDVQVERIGFYSTTCFGSCPEMYIEMDSSGNILFYGGSSTDKRGLYKGKISSDELGKVMQKIQNIELDSLSQEYSAPWEDDQVCGVKIKTASKEYESSAYGFHKEPVELRILIHKLMETYKVAVLEQDSTIKDEFVFKDFLHSAYPLPPEESE